MDGFTFDAVPCDGCSQALAEFLAQSLALLPTRPLIAIALVILIVVAGIDAARIARGPRA